MVISSAQANVRLQNWSVSFFFFFRFLFVSFYTYSFLISFSLLPSFHLMISISRSFRSSLLLSFVFFLSFNRPGIAQSV